MSLNDEVIAYFQVNKIAYASSWYTISAGPPEQITYWNTAQLGPQPSQDQLNAAYAIWLQEQAAANAIIQEQNKTQASALLSATDWTSIPDVANPSSSNPYLLNQSEFLAWRSQIRAIAVNPPTTPATFPTQPTEKWSS